MSGRERAPEIATNELDVSVRVTRRAACYRLLPHAVVAAIVAPSGGLYHHRVL